LRTTLQTSVLLAMPIALGCWLYADIGVQIFSKSSFEPARDNLRILSLFLFLLYFSMILGTGIIAAGRQKAWTLTQFACVLVSALADPFLIPWFQRRAGNGGLGVCVSAVFSEVLMVAVGLALAPAGLIDRVLLRSFAAAVAAALAMVAVAVGLSRLQLNSFLAAPISVAAYAAALRLTGQLDRDKLQVLRSLLKKDAGDS
jgi:Na+-driven multidrug efflux pump